MVLGSRKNSTFVLRRNSVANCLLNRLTVRTYYAGTLGVPLAIFEWSAILFASGTQQSAKRTVQGTRGTRWTAHTRHGLDFQWFCEWLLGISRCRCGARC